MQTYLKWPGYARYITRKEPDTAGVNVVQSVFCPIGNAYQIHPDGFMRKGMFGGPEDNVVTIIVNPADYIDLMRKLSTTDRIVRIGVFIKSVRRLNHVRL